MRKIYIWLYVCFLGLSLQAETVIESFRFNHDTNKTRLVWDISEPNMVTVTKANNPSRIIIKFETAKTKTPLFSPEAHPWIQEIRTIIGKDKSVKVVLTTKKEVEYSEFFLKPYKNTGHRFVLDLKEEINTAQVLPLKPKKPNTSRALPLNYSQNEKNSKRFLVVIDAGHGGKDPGAIGQYGTREKDISLSIAKKLASLVRDDPNMDAILVRDDDFFIELPVRISKASELKANLFLSIHTDSAPNLAAAGSSTFVLSEKGAYEEARRMLNIKNSGTELAGGFGQANLWTSLSLDFRIDNTKKASEQAAELILNKLSEITKPSFQKVKNSEFTVLRSLQVPAILVETDFISNAEREKLLNTNWYQNKIAKAIYEGIKEYSEFHAPY
jgi:N-acetylmuramoyl-L-alanine amidase